MKSLAAGYNPDNMKLNSWLFDNARLGFLIHGLQLGELDLLVSD